MISTTSSSIRPKTPASKGSGQDWWTVRVAMTPDVFAYPPAVLKMLLVFESFFRANADCWHGDAKVAQAYGYDISRGIPGAYYRLIRQMEELGILSRIPVDPNRPSKGREGFLIHKRLDPDKPVWDKPPPPEGIQRLRDRRRRGQSCPTGDAPTAQMGGHLRSNGRTTSAQMGGAPTAQMGGQNKDEFRKKDESKNDDNEQAGSSSFDALTDEEQENRANWPMEGYEAIVEAKQFFGADLPARKVLAAVQVYGEEWVCRALDIAKGRQRRKVGNLPVKDWSYILGTLKNWRNEGGPPPEKAARPPLVAATASAPASPPNPPAAVAVAVAPAPRPPDATPEASEGFARRILDKFRGAGGLARWDEAAGRWRFTGRAPRWLIDDCAATHYRGIAAILDRERAEKGGGA